MSAKVTQLECGRAGDEKASLLSPALQHHSFHGTTVLRSGGDQLVCLCAQFPNEDIGD